jgi:hypothetical protein
MDCRFERSLDPSLRKRGEVKTAFEQRQQENGRIILRHHDTPQVEAINT